LYPFLEAQFEIVAIAHRDVQHIWELKGKRLCYPGFNIGEDVTKIFLTVAYLFFFFFLFFLSVVRRYKIFKTQFNRIKMKFLYFSILRM